jgi:hypothetical protein
MQGLIALSKEPKLKASYEQLESFVWSEPSEISRSTRKSLIAQLRHHLKALVLIDLMNLDEGRYAQNPSLIVKHFNEFMERREPSSWDDIIWAFNQHSEYEPNFLLRFPHFDSSDIKSLCVVLSGDGPQKSFLLEDCYVLSPELLKGISSIPANSRQLFQTAQEIACLSLQVISGKVDVTDPIKEIETILSGRPQMTEQKVYDKLIVLAKLCAGLDRGRITGFVADDLFFLREGWINRVDEARRFPSLSFWLISNPECERELRHYLGALPLTGDSIPIQLHFLRIFSSWGYFDPPSESPHDLMAAFHTCIGANLKTRCSSLKWINLLIDTVPPAIADQNLQLTRRFVRHLSVEYRTSEREFPELVTDSVKKLIQDIVDSIFTGNFESVFSETIGDSRVASFFLVPGQEATNRFVEESQRHRQALISEIGDKFRDIVPRVAALKKFQNELPKHISEDCHRQAQCQREQQLNQAINRIEEKRINFQTNVNTYRKIWKKLASPEPGAHWSQLNAELTQCLRLKADFVVSGLAKRAYSLPNKPVQNCWMLTLQDYEMYVWIDQTRPCAILPPASNGQQKFFLVPGVQVPDEVA